MTARHLRALLMPFAVTFVIPALILLLTNSANIAAWRVPIAAVLFAAGVSLMYSTIRLFVTQGDGTIMPWDPTQKLVVRGIYRHVRNPMITGVCCVVLAEAVLFGSLPLFIWFAAAVLLNVIYIPLSEEPGLERRFGESYRVYKQNVPRWIPRLTAWQPNQRGEQP